MLGGVQRSSGSGFNAQWEMLSPTVLMIKKMTDYSLLGDT